MNSYLIISSFRIILGISIALISVLSIQEIDVQSSISLSDKFLHFSCFLYLTIISWFSRIIYKELWLYVIVLGYGILIEIVQIYIPYRFFEFLDIFADFLGILAGSFLINFFKDLYPKY
jgi:VanZ family protein